MMMKLSAMGAWLWQRKRVLLAGALICTLLMSVLGSLDRDKSYQIRVSYIYPGSENGLYPDGGRLLRDDLIDTDRVEEALIAMSEKGWYTDIPAAKIRDNLRVRENLSNPVQSRVQSLRAQGEEYTYYNNEFILSFTQPCVLHLKDSSDWFGLTRPDRSKEFVEALMHSVFNNFIAEHTEGEVFAEFSSYMYVGDLDYSGIVDACDEMVTLCINYLTKKQEADSTFVSRTTGLSFADLIASYQSLADVQIARLLKYTSAGKLTRSLDELVNRLEVEIEDQQLVEKKKLDESSINKKAMLEYDHTFSENIIIVSVNEENGLYQARPKTGYDTVTQRTLDAGVAATNAANIVANDQRLISEYTESMAEPGVQARLDEAEAMVKSIYEEYDRLRDLSVATIRDYLTQNYSNYIRTSEAENEQSALGTLVRLCAFFAVGLCLTAVLCLMRDRRRQKKAAEKEVR